MVAHTKSYAKVLIKREQDLVGKQVIVKVVDIHKWHVYGEIIDRNPKPIHVRFEDHFKGIYKVNKNVNDNNRMAEIKKEQVDIHATINIPSSKSEIENVNNTQTNIGTNNGNKLLNFSLNEMIGMILYVLSIYFLYLGMKNWIKIKLNLFF
jgi:hypothetical protein